MTNYLRNWFQNRRQNARPAKTAFDFYSIGYPKTGNTWTRILLGSYVRSLHNLPELPLFDPVEMAELKSRGYDGPTGIFTHQPLEWSDQDSGELTFQNVIAPFLEQKVILLVRHPLDTLVSSFMHWKHRSTPQYSGTLRDFVSDPVFGLDKLLRFYQLWADHHTAVGSFFVRDMRTLIGIRLASCLGWWLSSKSASTRTRSATLYPFHRSKILRGWRPPALVWSINLQGFTPLVTGTGATQTRFTSGTGRLQAIEPSCPQR